MGFDTFEINLGSTKIRSPSYLIIGDRTKELIGCKKKKLVTKF